MNQKSQKRLMPFREAYLRILNGTLTLILIGFFLVPYLLLSFIQEENPSLTFQLVAFLLMLTTASALGAAVAKRLPFIFQVPLLLLYLVISVLLYPTSDMLKLWIASLILPTFIYIPYRRIAKRVETAD